MTHPTLTRGEIDARITFHETEQIMEVSFAGLRIESSADINAFYDRIEARITTSGEPLWFFLVNYSGTWIDSSAWIAHSRRGRALNQAHSMGSVRFDLTEETRARIERDAGTESFDPNLFATRDGALAHLRGLPSLRRKPVKTTASISRADLNWRIGFHPQEGIMEADFSNLSFENARDVNEVFNFIEDQIAATGRQWYFLVNYDGTRIQSPAWVQYARRGKSLNETWSLGSVRYAPGSETETDIRLRAQSQGFRPNIRNTREEALQRIEEMKAEQVEKVE